MSIDKLEEGLYVTDLNGLRDTLRLQQLGIKCVLNMAQSALYEESGSEEGLRHALADFDLKIMELADHEAQDISHHFHEIAGFIKAGQSAGGVVVHCASGVSRAAAGCLCFLMLHRSLSLDAAYSQLVKVRPCAFPNRGFWRQLRILEQSIVADGQELAERHPGAQSVCICRAMSKPSGADDSVLDPRGEYQPTSQPADVKSRLHRLDADAGGFNGSRLFLQVEIRLSLECALTQEAVFEQLDGGHEELDWVDLQDAGGRVMMARLALDLDEWPMESCDRDELVRNAIYEAIEPGNVDQIEIEKCNLWTFKSNATCG